jgi:hypothetical protein
MYAVQHDVATEKCERDSNDTKYAALVNNVKRVRFEVFTAVTMKKGVFCDVTPRGSCKNRRFGGT